MKRLSVTDRVAEVCAWIESGRARELRVNSGITQSEMARTCEVTQAAVLRWERNERRPRGRNAITYHKALSRLAAREQGTAA
ncbi:helix-turn-helix domain-containing protein [Streptomyces hokutonensis]|uniref:Helix-turn-helix domain-containing protein n=1 Tax=Streptomyces hokutonensis TaxID=1306990 RepID=A0ABW6M9J0_9ACTN